LIGQALTDVKMRVASTLLLLPVLAAAQQVPIGDQLRGWFEKAKSFVPGAVTSPKDAGAAKVAAENVVTLNKDNWATELAHPKPGKLGDSSPQWMVLISGGNKTCYGACEPVEKAWNVGTLLLFDVNTLTSPPQEAVALMSADPFAPNFGYVNCDEQRILCSVWACGPPQVWYFEVGAEGNPQARPLYITHLNQTIVTSKDIVEIQTKKTYKDVQPYEGYFHPFDGILAKTGALVPFGYVIYAFTIIPSWLLMVSISFISRTFM
jgi:hypothetical protein